MVCSPLDQDDQVFFPANQLTPSPTEPCIHMTSTSPSSVHVIGVKGGRGLVTSQHHVTSHPPLDTQIVGLRGRSLVTSQQLATPLSAKNIRVHLRENKVAPQVSAVLFKLFTEDVRVVTRDETRTPMQLI